MIEINIANEEASCVSCKNSNYNDPKDDIFTIRFHRSKTGQGVEINLCPKCMDKLNNKVLEASVEHDIEKNLG